MTWREQQTATLDAISRQHGAPAKREFVTHRNKSFAELAGELKTRRQILDSMRRKYEALRAVYLRVTGTTYEGWSKYGPQPEWDEVIAAAADDAVWDRLVERCTREIVPARSSRRRAPAPTEDMP